MANDVSVRSYLQGQGVNNNDIGYDQNTGNVQIKGQNFIRPAANLAGTTYDSQQNLDSAYGNYAKAQQTTTPNIGALAGVNAGLAGNGIIGAMGKPNVAGATGAPAQTAPTQSTQYTNPYTQQIADLMKHLSDSSSAQPADIYGSPQYAAAKANQDRQSADTIRHASESAAGAGLGHSTIMTDRTQRIQDDSNNYLQTQLVPQIQAQLQAQRQQELANQESQLHDYMTLGQQADSQHNADRTYDAGRQDAATAATGYYNPSGQTAQQVQAQMDKNSAAYAAASPAEKDRLHSENMGLANLLGKEYDSPTGTYSKGQGFVGTRTVQGQQLDQQKAQQAWDNEFKNEQFTYQKASDLWERTFKDKSFDQSVKQAAANLGLDYAKMNQAGRQFTAEMAFKEKSQQLEQDKFDYTKNQASPELQKELDGLYTGLSSGQITGGAAIDEINGKVKAGILTQLDADKMLKLVETTSNSNPPSEMPKLTQNQIEASGGTNPQDLNSTQLEKLWNTDSTGKTAGRPVIDWSEWYRDPRGRVGGVSYDAWHKAYGPQLKAR